MRPDQLAWAINKCRSRISKGKGGRDEQVDLPRLSVRTQHIDAPSTLEPALTICCSYFMRRQSPKGGGQGLAQPGFQLKDSLFEAKLAEACRGRHGGLLPM